MRQEAFIAEYLRNGFNGTAAWMYSHPGCMPSTAATSAYQALRNPQIAARMAEARAALAQKYVADRESLLQEFLQIARADPNELTQLRQVACGHCYRGQRGNAMYVDPDPECEACMGDGVSIPWYADTRRLSPGAKALFAGIKQTKDGVQVLMHNRVEALVNAAKIVGAFKADNEQKTEPMAEVLRQFFAGLHGNRLPIAKAETVPEAPGHPLVRSS